MYTDTNIRLLKRELSVVIILDFVCTIARKKTKVMGSTFSALLLNIINGCNFCF